MNETTTFQFDGWAVIEFLGHRKRAGKVRTAEIGGTAVFIVETPAEDQESGFVAEVYAASSLYCLTPCSEQVARISARHINPEPISRYDLPDPVRQALAAAEHEEWIKRRAIDAPDEDDDGVPFA